jgi:hypothetical protein
MDRAWGTPAAKEFTLRKLLFTAVVASATLAFSGSAVAKPFGAFPGVFVGTVANCGSNGTPGGQLANWKKNIGLPDVSGTRNWGLRLEKNVATTDCSAAVADIGGEKGTILSTLGFDYNGYCSLGSPRYTVVLADGETYFFFGCGHGTHTATPNAPSGWNRVRFTDADAFPANGGTWPGFGEAQIKQIQIVQDEQGQVTLDNIRINDQYITQPST